MARLRPTTKAQISGHRFLQRRLEHGLVLGDIRMIHDPLARRNRAAWISVGLSVLIAAGAGLIAWLQPNPDPGAQPIVRTAQGQVLANIDGTFHPVPNLVSARLLTGAPADAAPIGPDILAAASLGVPAGLADAPGFLNSSPSSTPWALCQEPTPEDTVAFVTSIDAAGEPTGRTIVHAQRPVRLLGPEDAALVVAERRTWLITEDGRRPLDEDELATTIARVVGIEPDAPRRAVPPEFLNAVSELPAFALPADLPEVWDSGHGLWAHTDDGVAPLTAAQAEVLVASGARLRDVPADDVAAQPDAELSLNLPTRPLRIAPADDRWLCATGNGVGFAWPTGGLVPLAGEAVATHFGGLDAGGVAVDTGHGRLVVSATGTRHTVPSQAEWEALGLNAAASAPWDIVRLLPEGSELSRVAALAGDTGAVSQGESSK
ncbi:type VII secretion protein EccB [Corynebacterium phoceense]|uniref:type VII secretion protein EccB n=1 Tax=Corynebacterium phoceense TaxID=1686286 RepID=UPI0034CDB01B